MSNIVNVLAKAILQCGKSISDISRRSKISRPMLYKIIKKEVSTVSADTIEAISHATGIDINYLVSLENENYEPRKKKGIRIPVLGTIPAGVPIEAIEDVIDYEEISEEMAKTGDYFALKVRGDSMLPTIKDGDVVIVKKQDDADSGKICVVMINGFDATLKEIKKDPQGVWVLPHNPSTEFKPSFYSNTEIESVPVRIIGVAVEIRRSL